MSSVGDVPSSPVVYEELVVGAEAVGFAALPPLGQLVRSEARLASGPINWRKDGGTPTTTFGVPAFDGDVFALDRNEAVRFRAVRQGVTNGILRIHHFVRT